MTTNMITSQHLANASNSTTTLLSLIIPPNDSLIRIQTMLSSELICADNIKNNNTQKSIRECINMAINNIKQYTNVPPNGLLIYISNNQLINICIQPSKPINISLYMIDKMFHLQHVDNNDIDTNYTDKYTIY
jgi:peptide chain release factor subunit 1